VTGAGGAAAGWKDEFLERGQVSVQCIQALFERTDIGIVDRRVPRDAEFAPEVGTDIRRAT